jgi:hypothetical protein
MDNNLLLGFKKFTVPIPRMIWQRRVQGGAQLGFMSEEHHRIRNYVVTELPREGRPLSPECIAQALELPLSQVIDILVDLEQHMTFLFRDKQGAVQWAYPVTVDQTPHQITFSTGECVNAA